MAEDEGQTTTTQDSPAPPPEAGGAAPASPSAEFDALIPGVGEAPVEPTPTPTPKEPEPPPTPVPTYKYRGREYTVEQLVANGLLGDVLTTAEQFPALQKKYQERLEQDRQPQQPSQPQQLTPQQFQAGLRAHYAPEIARAAEVGLVEADAAELYPNLMAQAFHLVHRLDALEQALGGVLNESSQNSRTHGVSVIDAALDRLAGQGELYDALKDRSKRGEFLTWATESIDPRIDVRDTDKLEAVLKALWIARNGEALIEASRQTAEAERQKQADAKRRAQGEGRGPRPTPAPAQPMTVADEFDAEMGLLRRP